MVSNAEWEIEQETNEKECWKTRNRIMKSAYEALRRGDVYTANRLRRRANIVHPVTSKESVNYRKLLKLIVVARSQNGSENE